MNLVFFGHHKCASRFFRLRLFAPLGRSQDMEVISYRIDDPPYHFSRLPDLDLDNVDFARLDGPDDVVLNLLNSSPEVRDRVTASTRPFRGLRVVRDPRQVLVSSYFHHRDGHPITSENGFVWDQLGTDRPTLRALDEEDGLIHEMDNIAGSVVGEQLASWWHDPRVLEVRLEDVNQDRDRFLEQLWIHLGVEGLPHVKWGDSFSDSGAGRWQHHFTERVTDEFKRRFNASLVELGYERDDSWAATI